jgi:hypothetical protein
VAGNTGFEVQAGHQNPMRSLNGEHFDNTQFFSPKQLFSNASFSRYSKNVEGHIKNLVVNERVNDEGGISS